MAIDHVGWEDEWTRVRAIIWIMVVKLVEMAARQEDSWGSEVKVARRWVEKSINRKR